MASAPQDSAKVEGNAAQDNSVAKKRRHASSGGVQGNPPPLNIRGPKIARAICRAKGKPGQKAASQDANPSPLKEKSDKSYEKGRDPEAELHMFAEVSAQFF